MKPTLPILGIVLFMMSVQSALAQAGPQSQAKTSNSNPEQEVIALSKDKWRWMAERNVEALDKLFAEEAVFVHMGGTMSKSQELDTIKTGGIQYKDAQIQEVSVRSPNSTGRAPTIARPRAVSPETPCPLHHTTSDERGRFLEDRANYRLAALLRWGRCAGELPTQEATTSAIRSV